MDNKENIEQEIINYQAFNNQISTHFASKDYLQDLANYYDQLTVENDKYFWQTKELIEEPDVLQEINQIEVPDFIWKIKKKLKDQHSSQSYLSSNSQFNSILASEDSAFIQQLILYSYQKEISQLTKTLQRHQDEKEVWESNAQDLIEKISILEAEIKKIYNERELTEKIKERFILENKLIQSQEKVDLEALREKYQVRERELTSLADKLSLEQEKSNELMATIEELQNKIQRLELDINRRTEEFSNLYDMISHELVKERSEKRLLQGDLKDKDNELKTMGISRDNYKREADQYAFEWNEVDNKHRTLLDKNANLTTRINDLNSKLHTTEDKLSTLQLKYNATTFFSNPFNSITLMVKWIIIAIILLTTIWTVSFIRSLFPSRRDNLRRDNCNHNCNHNNQPTTEQTGK